MAWLWAASLLWAFSFGLIKGHLTGYDPTAVAAGRLVLATIVFAPVLVRSVFRLAPRTVAAALGLGVVQFGAMYVLYIASYARLAAWQVAVFTVFTPLYVVALSAAGDRRLAARTWAAAGLAVGGALVVAWASPEGVDGRGVALLQGANFCFAAGQLGYRRLRARTGAPDASLIGTMYAGAALATACVALIRTGGVPWSGPAWSSAAVASLVYLGLLPTGLGFYLWNRGAARAGAGALAVANNLKVPLAVLVSWLVFGEQTAYLRVLIGLTVILAALALAAEPGNRRDKAT